MKPGNLAIVKTRMGCCSEPHCNFGMGFAAKKRHVPDRRTMTKFEASFSQRVVEH